MTTTTHDHDHADADPVTDQLHNNSWSANLEKPEHAEDRELIIEQAIEAIRYTESGYHVKLVTHGDHGHPANYLYSKLEDAPIERPFDWQYIEQCGCGGHVTRVNVE